MALGVYLTFRVLDIADLIVDPPFTIGAAVVVVMITAGQNPWLATPDGSLAGCVAGTVTGFLHVNAGIHPLFAGVLARIDLYPINPYILGKANVSLFRGVKALPMPLHDRGLSGSWISIPTFACPLYTSPSP